MTQDPPICGSTDTESGEPCGRPAGWGTPSDIGPCRDHPAEGRPSKFTHERANAAIDAARSGASIRGCAQAAGVTKPTLTNWLELDPHFRHDRDGTKEFLPTFLRARWQGQKRLIDGALDIESTMDPTTARFLLSRSFGYDEIQRLEIDNLSDEEATATASRLESIFSE